ncbi:hypothetical protein LSH36_260g05000 [Paralvinella palmiformis]|uniref:ATP synthase peripheral stalk subunit OSCP, mitochondrial n=1 Tax=Paralvinella palmiformis TaxID=53620 RepID=A0AAD9JLJ6_9ANNE|nr:hypothetical protein LSH36_260g05000 [Paralvinella palmiformis]
MAAARFGVLVRNFSTSASRSKLTTAPIQVFGIEGRYAHALYSAATKEKKLEVVENELKKVQVCCWHSASTMLTLLATDVKFHEFMFNPAVKRTEKRDVLDTVLVKQRVSPLTVNLLKTLAENGRITQVNNVIKAFGKIMSAYRGEVSCTVITAKPLDSSSLKELQNALKGFVKKGETLQLETQVDPSIIGGMIVNLGDKYVDMSIATKVKTYTNLIKEAA